MGLFGIGEWVVVADGVFDEDSECEFLKKRFGKVVGEVVEVVWILDHARRGGTEYW